MHVMEVAMIALLFLVLFLVGSVASVFVVLSRRNRIIPAVRTPAPLTWLWLPTAAARAHRRLGRALRAARHTISHGAIAGVAVRGLTDCTDDLERHALALDEQLVIASRFGLTTRRTMLRSLRSDVHEIEVLAARISTTVVARSSMSAERVTGVVTRVTERLDALDAAHRELAALETTWRAPAPAPQVPESSSRQGHEQLGARRRENADVGRRKPS